MAKTPLLYSGPFESDLVKCAKFGRCFVFKVTTVLIETVNIQISMNTNDVWWIEVKCSANCSPGTVLSSFCCITTFC